MITSIIPGETDSKHSSLCFKFNSLLRKVFMQTEKPHTSSFCQTQSWLALCLHVVCQSQFLSRDFVSHIILLRGSQIAGTQQVFIIFKWHLFNKRKFAINISSYQFDICLVILNIKHVLFCLILQYTYLKYCLHIYQPIIDQIWQSLVYIVFPSSKHSASNFLVKIPAHPSIQSVRHSVSIQHLG